MIVFCLVSSMIVNMCCGVVVCIYIFISTTLQGVAVDL